jgi:hypothetical protein
VHTCLVRVTVVTGRAVAFVEPGSTHSRLERILQLQTRLLPRSVLWPKSKWLRLVLAALTLWAAVVAVYFLVTGQYTQAVYPGLVVIWFGPARCTPP